jgi:glycerol-3-phosphate acyltransferase PlsY
VIFLIFRYVSLGSMICMTLPAFMIFIPGIDYIYLFDHSLLYKDNYHPEVLIQMWIMFIILCNSSIMIIRHIPNIKRLLRHEEKRFF